MSLIYGDIYHQYYIFPALKITTSRMLNGSYEIIFMWLNKYIAIEF
jgi:hypothetical protein